MSDSPSRRSFLQALGLTAAAMGAQTVRAAEKKEKVIQGFEQAPTDPNASKDYKPISDRKLRVGIAGYGVCKFGAAFGFQNHPNVEIIGVADLDPAKCAGLAEVCKCEQKYESCEEMAKNDKIEAIFIATDAPSHARLAIDAMKKGKHVASAVPAVFGSLEEADKLFEAVKKTGMKYMMFETSYFHGDLYEMRELYKKDELGKLVYSEGEYYHFMSEPLPSYNGWRVGLPPQYYPTHSDAYYVGVTGGSFTEVSCMGMPSIHKHLTAEGNSYKNPFGTEIALFRTSEGGMSRMAVSWDTPGYSGEMGRIRGQKGSYYGKFQQEGKDVATKIGKPALPPGVDAGGHGGSHGYLMHDFVSAVLQDRKPLVDVAQALNMTVAGIVAHQSAMKDGELLKIPQYKL